MVYGPIYVCGNSVRIVKNELVGGSATQQEIRGWGHNGMNRELGGGG